MRILIYLREQLLLIFVRLVERGDFIKSSFRNESHVFNLFFYFLHFFLFRHASLIFFLKINLNFILNINNFKWVLLIISSILHSYFILLDDRMIALIRIGVLCHCTSLRLQKYFKYTSLFKNVIFIQSSHLILLPATHIPFLMWLPTVIYPYPSIYPFTQPPIYYLPSMYVNLP